MLFRILSDLFLIIGIFTFILKISKIIAKGSKKNKITSYYGMIVFSIICINVSYTIYSLVRNNNLFICGVVVLICIMISEYFFIKNFLKRHKKL